jgi:hypothetical protein
MVAACEIDAFVFSFAKDKEEGTVLLGNTALDDI